MSLLHRLIGLTVAFVALLGASGLTFAENARITKLRTAERKAFTDAEIFDGFFRVSFGAEMQFDNRVDNIRKYEGPVRIYIDNRAKPDRTAQILDVVADIKSRVQHLDIAVTTDGKAANVFVRLLNARDFAPALSATFGKERARQIQKSLGPQCLSGFSKDADFRIQRSDVFLVADKGEFDFLDCAYEELLQSLGPINDTDKVRWTMFNDRVRLGFFNVYDQYLLNIHYHPRVRAGMTRDDVKALLPQIMPDVRAFVTKRNNLP